MPLQKGDQAPDVTLPSTTHEQVSLGSLYRDRTTVVVFFPLAFTSTCTEELCTFRDDLSVYNGLGVQVAAVSVDSPFVLDRFRKEIGADYLFLSDFNREASQAFGVLREAPLGPGLRNASDRAVFVVGQDGAVRYAWHSSNPSLLPPFDEIRAAVAA
jgi:peroxiredoxin